MNAPHPDFAPRAGGTPPEAADLRPCQSCGALVRMAAAGCRYCGEPLAGGHPLPFLVERVARKLRQTREQEESGQFPHRAAARYGPSVRKDTLAKVGLALGLFLVYHFRLEAFVEWLYPVASEQTIEFALIFYRYFGGFLIALLVIYAGGCLWNDLLVPSDASRSDPEGTMRAFFHALRVGRWKYAYAMVLPADKDALLRARVRIPGTNVPGGAYVIDTPRGFRNYWRPMVLGYWIYSSTVRLRSITAERIDGRNAIVECRYILPGDSYALAYAFAYPLSFLFIPFYNLLLKRVEIRLVKYLRRVGDRWYLVSGDIQSGEDLLPKVYAGETDRLERGELPPPEAFPEG